MKDHPHPYKRRRRARLACQECRDRKIRCDGATPLCDSCKRKNVDPRLCVYPVAENSLNLLSQDVSRPKPQKYPSDTWDDIQRNSSNTDPASNQSWAGTRRRRSQSPPSPGRVRLLPSTTMSAQLNHHRVYEDERVSILAGHVDADKQYEEMPPRVVGSSSSFGFIENVHQVLRQSATRTNPSVKDDYDTTIHHSGSINNSPYRARTTRETKGVSVDDVSLPPRSLMDHFLRIYWNEIHVLSPLFHEQTFMQRYDNLCTNGPATRQVRVGPAMEVDLLPSERILQATLNIILAIVYQRTNFQTPNNRDHQDKVFERAERLLSPDLMQIESMQLVQALVLKASYLREADMTNRSWIAVGVAIRTAQAVGVHVESTGGSQVEREERRRVWYNCVLMDKTQSMTYGRPAMISGRSAISHPEQIDDEYLSVDKTAPDGVQPSGRPARMAFFVNTVRLVEITSRIRRLFYDNTQHTDGDGTSNMNSKQYAAVIELDDELGKWHDQLPSYLRDAEFTPDDHRSCFIRQRTYLRCQFLHWRIILFRRTLVDYARESSSPSQQGHTTLMGLKHILSRGCVEICIDTAQKLLGTIEPNIGTDRLPAGWYIASYYLYNVGAIIALAILSPRLQALCKDAAVHNLRRLWRQCLNCLRQYDRLGVRFAQSCTRRLRRMLDENDDNGEQQHNPDVGIDDGNNSGQQRGTIPAFSSRPPESSRFEENQPPNLLTETDHEFFDSLLMNQDFHWMSNVNISEYGTDLGLEGIPTLPGMDAI